MENVKISIEPITLTRQRMVDKRMMELELADTWFAYRFKFRAEEPDEKDDQLPWEEVDNDFDSRFPKGRFAGLEKHWVQKGKRWKIIINIDGVAQEISVFFKKQKDCEAVFDQLVDYFFN